MSIYNDSAPLVLDLGMDLAMCLHFKLYVLKTKEGRCMFFCIESTVTSVLVLNNQL